MKLEDLNAARRGRNSNQMLDFYFRWSRSKGGEVMVTKKIWLVGSAFGFCIHFIIWIL